VVAGGCGGCGGAEVEALVKRIPDVENFVANLYKGPQEIVEEGPRKRNCALEHL
jgi:Ni,Fe-hydrogenase III small subunit